MLEETVKNASRPRDMRKPLLTPIAPQFLAMKEPVQRDREENHKRSD